jgi:Homoserine O-succinyltransferase
MTILSPKNYHLRDALQERRILCIDPEDALKEDIRALRIGILNIMPKVSKNKRHARSQLSGVRRGPARPLQPAVLRGKIKIEAYKKLIRLYKVGRLVFPRIALGIFKFFFLPVLYAGNEFPRGDTQFYNVIA